MIFWIFLFDFLDINQAWLFSSGAGALGVLYRSLAIYFYSSISALVCKWLYDPYLKLMNNRVC